MHNQIVIQPQTFGSTLLIGNVDGGNNKQSILLVALNRQKVKNAFNDEQYLDLISVLTKVETDETLHAIVLTGMGNYFSSGADLSSTNFGEDDSNEDDDVGGIKFGNGMNNLFGSGNGGGEKVECAQQ